MWTAATTSRLVRGHYVGVVMCFGGRCSAATSTAQHDGHYSVEWVSERGCWFLGRKVVTLRRHTKREKERLGTEGWMRRICVNVPHKPQVPLPSYQSYPKDNAAQMRDKEGKRQKWSVAGKEISLSFNHVCLSPYYLYYRPFFSLYLVYFLFQTTGGRMSEIQVEFS